MDDEFDFDDFDNGNESYGKKSSRHWRVGGESLAFSSGSQSSTFSDRNTKKRTKSSRVKGASVKSPGLVGEEISSQAETTLPSRKTSASSQSVSGSLTKLSAPSTTESKSKSRSKTTRDPKQSQSTSLSTITENSQRPLELSGDGSDCSDISMSQPMLKTESSTARNLQLSPKVKSAPSPSRKPLPDSPTDSLASAPLQSSASPSTTSSKGSSPNRLSKPRIPNSRPREKSWMTELEDDDGNCKSRKRIRKEVLETTLPDDKDRGSRAIGIGTRNAFSLRNTGDFQMLHDEFLFLCNSLRDSQSSTSADRKYSMKTAANLLDILSSKRNRKVLLFDGQILRTGEDSALMAMLDLLGTFADMLESQEDGSWSPLKQSPTREKERLSPQRSLFPTIMKPGATVSAEDDGSPLQSPADNFLLHFLDVAGMIAYMLALDCTMSEAGASDSCPRSARALRYEVLSHPRALQGIMGLVRADSLVSSLRKRPLSVNQQRISYDSLAIQAVPGKAISSLETPQSPNEKSHHNVNSPMNDSKSDSLSNLSFTKHSLSDPTKTGRNRRKRTPRADLHLNGMRSVLESAPDEDNLSQSDKLSYTSAGSLRRKVFHAESDKRDDALDYDSLASADTQAAAIKKAFDKISTAVSASLPSPSAAVDTVPQHTCSRKKLVESRIIGDASHSVPLVALTWIVRGKTTWCEKSCLDVDVRDENAREFGNSSQTSLMEDPSLHEDEELDNNPLLQTNELLRKSGCLPVLSTSLAETLVSILWLLDKRTRCKQCIIYLHDRCSSLTSLVDEACLMNDDNRQVLCTEGYTPEVGRFLVTALVTFLQIVEEKRLIFSGRTQNYDIIWDEMALETLRSLTSLTHDSKFAARELKQRLKNRFSRAVETDELTGVAVLARVLYAAAVKGKHVGIKTSHHNKTRYDSIIFCLNALVNCIESSGGTLASTLANVWISVDDRPDGKINGKKVWEKRVNFLTWLTKWLVGETESFKDAIRWFGSQTSSHADRRLEDQEDETLVTAGNGFVLLASLLSHSADLLVKTSPSLVDFCDKSIQEIILAELPGEDRAAKLSFAKNLLRVFCNFYHVAVGDLSIAVVGPIKKLIRKLDELSVVA